MFQLENFRGNMYHDAERRCKFKGNLICGLKNKIRNLVHFYASSRKSKYLHFDRILLFKAYKDLDEKIQKNYVSWHWKVMQGLKKNWLVVPKMTRGICKLLPNHLKVRTFHFDGLFLFKVYEVWAKKIQRSCLSWHWTVMQNLNKQWRCCFKNGMRNWVNFH